MHCHLKSIGWLATLLLLLICTCGCNTKNNTALTRQWQAFTTRYNVYYNGHEAFKNSLADMERDYEDDYTRMLLTHPADARGDQKMPQPKGDFKRSIEKMQKAIQLHSIKKKPVKKKGTQKEKDFRAREEFNPFLHNAWLMMGKSQYYNGDFAGAASTFSYISKHFKWLPDVTTEALLWQARSYAALGWTYEAENVLHTIKDTQLTNTNLRNLYNLTEASYLVRSAQYEKAVKFLTDAAKNASGSQKNRLWFLLGQVYTQLGKKDDAYAAYKEAGKGASTAYRTKFNARIKRSEVYSGKDISKEVRSLQAMTRYQRNKEFQDQIYYAIGNLYLAHKDTAMAAKNYALAIEKSTRNGIDKALAQVALGNIRFDEHDYIKAQPCYAEAVPQLNASFPNYEVLKKRSDVLDELTVYAQNVHLQDSLLTLSRLSPDDQRKACEKIVADLIKKEKEAARDSALQAALEKRPDANAPMNQQGAPQGMMMNGDKSWYFYNAMTRNAGKTEFQRRWGARKLEDDWRRKNKTVFAMDTPEDTADTSLPTDSVATATDSVADAKATDPHNVEFYLKQIPNTEAEKQVANEVIQEGLYNMGVILKDKLEDFGAARGEFDRLLTQYPDNIYRLDVYYNMYLMAVRSNDQARANHWRDLIIADFPDSPYATAMRDPNYFDKLRQMHTIQENLYSEAYQAYLDNDNEKVHRLTADMEREYPLSKILPKFVFIDALSYLTQGDNAKMAERLEYLLQKWPDTDMTAMAGAIVKGVKEGRKPSSGSTNTRGMIWDIQLSSTPTDGTSQDAAGEQFTDDPDTPHYLVLAFARDAVNANQLLYNVASFNFSAFVVKDFDLEQMAFGNIGLLIIKGFDNLKDLEHYRTVMASSDFSMPEGVRPIMISKHNFDLMLRQGRTFDDYFKFQEEERLPASAPAGIAESSDADDSSTAETE